MNCGIYIHILYYINIHMTIDDRHLAVSKVLVISWMDLSWFRSLQEWCHWLEPQLSTQRPAVPWTVLCLLVCLGHPLHRFIIGKVEWQTKFKIILQVFFLWASWEYCNVTSLSKSQRDATKQNSNNSPCNIGLGCRCMTSEFSNCWPQLSSRVRSLPHAFFGWFWLQRLQK